MLYHFSPMLLSFLLSLLKRKYNVGHQVKQRWVFGGICQHGCGFLQEVPDRTAATLLPIIQQNIAPGTEIHRYSLFKSDSNIIQIWFKSELYNFHFSDMWAAYNGIANLAVAPAYTHFTVNHSVLFHQFYKLMKYQIT